MANAMTTTTSPASSSSTATAPAKRSDGTALIAMDPWLAPYAPQLRERYAHYMELRSRIERDGGLLGAISKGHLYFGFNRGTKDGASGVWYREWAPGARDL